MITSSTNSQIQYVRKLQSKRRARQQERLFVIEGTRLLEEALLAGCKPNLVLYTTGWGERFPQLIEELQASGAQIELVVDTVLASCSDVETPQGVLAVLPMAETSMATTQDVALVIDRMADPGNLGTVLRTALAANVGTVYLTSGTVDVYNPKVVRAGMGAHFHLQLQEASIEQIIEALGNLELWIAGARLGQVYHQVSWHKPIALAIGSEAQGIDPRLQAHAAGQVHIPIAANSESLNAATAAAIILFEIQRQRGN
ncbi:MAG: RNA methyltransferase [Anaerolineales bacterium]|nr:MAG: RNA methyltransferase [Anaerolineales bacterium]